MKILLYGGTFDPPHYGHLNNVTAAAALVQPDRVIVMPAGVPPHKAASRTAPALRLEMCRCFADLVGRPGISCLAVSGWEIERAAEGKANYTVETLRYLRGEYPQAELYLAMGSDMLLTFTQWREWQAILALAALVVESREEDDGDALAAAAKEIEQQGGRVLLCPVPPLAMTSSEIRSGVLDYEECCPPETAEVIRREVLYRQPDTLPAPGKGTPAMDCRRAKKLAAKLLGEKRFEHTMNVKKMAVKLARRYGADEEKAALAATLHDCAKEKPKAELLQILENHAIMADGAQNRPAPVWHGVAAAILAQTEWGVDDPEIISAIACHTTGKPGMSLLDKIIFLADMTSAERDWPGVEKLRKLEMKDIDEAMLAGLEQTVGFVRQCGKVEDPMSTAALEDIRALLANRKNKTETGKE